MIGVIASEHRVETRGKRWTSCGRVCYRCGADGSSRKLSRKNALPPNGSLRAVDDLALVNIRAALARYKFRARARRFSDRFG
jgi:hypothetical protein